ncbi:MAG: YceI family protein [Opitutales bacterium]|nr:YceI family protein [Opitutales bacterium]
MPTHTPHNPTEITPSDLHRILDTPTTPVILDVLTPEAHAEARLPGSINACVYAVAFAEQVLSLIADQATPIVVYGQSDETAEAEQAAQRLRSFGYTHVTRLSGGLTAWKAAGLPVKGSSTDQPLPPAGTFPVDVASSTILWTGRNRFNHHTGTLALGSGSLTMEDGQPTAAAFTIDMRSIACTDIRDAAANAGLVAHLLADDFFAVDRFPEAKFVLTKARPLLSSTDGTPTHHLKGDFTLRGITAPIEFDATLDPRPEGGWGAQALFAIDRTRWNVRYGSGRFFARLGQHLVSDHIHLHLKIFTKAQPLRHD